MPEVERKIALGRDVLRGRVRGVKGNIEKKHKTHTREGKLFRRVKWFSVKAIYLLPRR